MSRKSLVIFGCGNIGELALYYFSEDSDYEVVGFTLDRDFLSSGTFHGLPVVAFDDLQETFPSEEVEIFVALSYAKVNRLRQAKVDDAKKKGYKIASYISSRASVLTQVPIGENAFILEDNTIQPYVTIGSNVTMWSGNHIGHHSTIGDHCFISSHVVVSGGVRVGSFCFLGVNSTLRDHISIGESTVVGAGCLILADTEPKSVFVSKGSEKSRVPSNRLRNF